MVLELEKLLNFLK